MEIHNFRTVVLSTYALCGFSNISSVGILLGSSIAMCPERAADFAEVLIESYFRNISTIMNSRNIKIIMNDVYC